MLPLFSDKFLLDFLQNPVTFRRFFFRGQLNDIAQVKTFLTPESQVKPFGNIFWFTNLDFSKRHRPLDLCRTYDPTLYPKYDNYDAIEVGRVSDIPYDYDGAMGVPISFLTRYCPDQFILLGLSSTITSDIPVNLPKHLRGGVRFYLKDQTGNYRRLYERLVIQRKMGPSADQKQACGPLLDVYGTGRGKTLDRQTLSRCGPLPNPNEAAL